MNELKVTHYPRVKMLINTRIGSLIERIEKPLTSMLSRNCLPTTDDTLRVIAARNFNK
jgi:hypothetical protein